MNFIEILHYFVSQIDKNIPKVLTIIDKRQWDKMTLKNAFYSKLLIMSLLLDWLLKLYN